MRSSYIFEVVHLVDTDIHLVLDNEVKELIGILFELIPGRDVIEQRWAENLGILGPESSAGCVSAVRISSTTDVIGRLTRLRTAAQHHWHCQSWPWFLCEPDSPD